MPVFKDAKGNVKLNKVEAHNVSGRFTGNLTGDLYGAAHLPSVTVATLPIAAGNTGLVLLCSDAGSGGVPALVVSDGSAWKQISLVAIGS